MIKLSSHSCRLPASVLLIPALKCREPFRFPVILHWVQTFLPEEGIILKTPMTTFQNTIIFEGFGGFYTSFRDIGVFEIYAGYGEGGEKHTFAYNDWDWGGGGWVQDGTAEMKFSSLFLQPDVGIRTKNIEAAFSLRLSRIDFKEVTYSGTVYRLDELQDLSTNRNIMAHGTRIYFQGRLRSGKIPDSGCILTKPFKSRSAI